MRTILALIILTIATTATAKPVSWGAVYYTTGYINGDKVTVVGSSGYKVRRKTRAIAMGVAKDNCDRNPYLNTRCRVLALFRNSCISVQMQVTTMGGVRTTKLIYYVSPNMVTNEEQVTKQCAGFCTKTVVAYCTI